MPMSAVFPRRSTPSGSTALLCCTTYAHLSEKKIRVGSCTDAINRYNAASLRLRFRYRTRIACPLKIKHSVLLAVLTPT